MPDTNAVVQLRPRPASVVEIVPASLATLDAEAHGAAALAAQLGVAPPASWPPPLAGPETRTAMRRLITDHPDWPGFGSWYIIADRRLVGICGCKGPPDADGIVEIGYAIVASEQGRGHASAAVARLLAFLLADPHVVAVIAETLPLANGSRQVLQRNGFGRAGVRHDPAIGPVLRFRFPAR